MAKPPPRPPRQEEAQIDAEVNEGGPPAPDRMTELPTRVVDVPDSKIRKPKKRKR
jgi:hypothetical protein